jgi:putative SOS response-associated peptidase YedK
MCKDPKKLESLLIPYSSEAMVAYPVSTLVNSPKNESPKCVEPATP